MAINKTFELRKQNGQYTALIPGSVNDDHAYNCQACGSERPEQLYPVTPKKGGGIIFVGSTCLQVLTSAKNPKIDATLKGSGETYQDGDKISVYITTEWLKKLGDFIFQTNEIYSRQLGKYTPNFDNDYNGAYHSVKYSQFLHSVYMQARDNNKISDKQYNKINEILSH